MFYEPSLEVDTFLTEQWLRPVHMNARVKITFYWNWTFLSATGILALFIKLEKQLNKEEVEYKIYLNTHIIKLKALKIYSQCMYLQ